jgi:hypothetical protein
MPHQSNHPPSTTCAIIDAARIFGELDTAQKLQTNFLSLYKGESEELLSAVAPYLFHFQPDSEFGKWLLEKGWGNSWGLFVDTDVSMEELQKHFRKFLMVKTEEEEELYFRFYDPRVLRVFLPTCDVEQLKDFFGPVKYYGMEDEEPEYALRFTFVNNKLVTERIPKAEFWRMINVSEDTIADGDKHAVSHEEQKPNEPSSNSGWSFLID